MAWTVTIARPAQKQAARFPAKDQNRIAAAVRSMAGDPFGGDVLKLVGEGNRWRRRVGRLSDIFRRGQLGKHSGGERDRPPHFKHLLI
jgi:hypothetical protein